MSEPTLESLAAGWDGQGVVVRHDRETGSWIFVALHDDSLGPPTGGTRMRCYPSPAAGLADAQRLAAGMTAKWAAIDFPFGGGKAVLAVPGKLEGAPRAHLLRTYGRLLESLQGSFSTGPDLGTTADDMREIRAVTSYVHGVDPTSGAAEDPGPYTARGVFAAIRAALLHTDGSGDLSGRRVLIEGVGSVGTPLGRSLAVAGARLLVSDLDAARAAAFAAEVGATVVPVADAPRTRCDVYSPCAVGGVLNRRSIPQLACRIVAGSANNQLEEEEDARRLLARGILYAPDYVANAGGALSFALMMRGAPPVEIEARLDGLGATVGEIFREAEAQGETPLAAAARRVEAVLTRARRAKDALTP
jgi:leucine dehydrogenase